MENASCQPQMKRRVAAIIDQCFGRLQRWMMQGRRPAGTQMNRGLVSLQQHEVCTLCALTAIGRWVVWKTNQTSGSQQAYDTSTVGHASTMHAIVDLLVPYSGCRRTCFCAPGTWTESREIADVRFDKRVTSSNCEPKSQQSRGCEG